ncbi:hypothetical protein [Sphingobium agri]|uniref:DUF541 domain-containing protein n=1 Tax=Sphingobium agri TaxID=2933566 RepID=A0ABT0DXD7_9SPHN|nr:hypothetical protein [Sphingobium agri]MCK0531771.1 hypothetical protein [Sphingobium agri]
MNGVMVMRKLFVAHAGLIALVPADRIAAGILPQGISLPAISLMSVSTADRNIPNPGTRRQVVERVQATVMAADYPSLKAVMAQVKKAGADQMPTVTGIENVTVHTDGMGPDFMNEAASIYMQPLDFRVTYSETR